MKKLAEGKLDVVVGTHRLLSADVRFKDLGLLVIDEEQRFGVAHKERIKKTRDAGRRADADRDADPAHAAPRDGGPARPVDHRDAAGRSPRGAHVRVARRRRDDPRGDRARARARRPGLLHHADDRPRWARSDADHRLPNDDAPAARRKPRDDDRTIDEWAEYLRGARADARASASATAR